MSSISTLIIKKPETFKESKKCSQKSRSVGFISMCLWTLAAIVAASNTETSANVTGVAVNFKVQDIMLMLITTVLLARGISTANPYLVYPWIVLSSWNMYSCQYPNIMKIIHILQHTKIISTLACVAFILHVIGLATKILLIIKITQVSVSLWYQRKLRKELIANMTK